VKRRARSDIDAHLAETLAAMADAVVLTDGDGAVIHLNPPAEQLFGRALADTAGRSLFSLFLDGSCDELRSRLDDPDALPATGRAKVEPGDGSREAFPVEVTCSRGAIDGAPIVICVVRDDRAELATTERSGAFETVADRAPALIWTSSPDGALVYANDSWLQFTGRSLDEQVGDGWLAEVHPDDVGSWRHVTATADRRRGFELELRIRRADETYRWMHVRAAPRRESDGTFAGWVVSSFDLTEERALNDVLRRRARQQAAVADLGRAALLGRSVDDLLEDATRIVADFFDVDIAAALELLPPGDEFLVRAAYGFATARAGMKVPARPNTPAGITLATAGPVAFDDLRTDTRFEPPSMLIELGVVSGVLTPIRGRERPFGVLAAYATHHRPFVEEDIVFLRSVANVVAAAILRQRAEVELSNREAEARLALDAGDMGSWLWDPRTGSMTWSAELERLCGLEPGTFPATFRAFVDIVHPDDREATLQAMAEAEARGDLVAEYRVVRPDGSVRWVEGRGRPLPEGPPSRWIGVTIDVTQRKHADDELRRLLDVERRVSAEAEAARRALAATVSRLDTLVNHAPIGLAFFDLDFRFTHVNEPLARINGRPIDAHLGHTVEEVVPGVWQVVEPAFRHVAETAEAVVGIEVGGQVGLPAEAQQHFLVTVYPVTDQDGVVGIGSIVIDITDRKRAELRAELIGDAGQLFASPLAADELRTQMCDVVVPRFADSCTLHDEARLPPALLGGTLLVEDVDELPADADPEVADLRARFRRDGLISVVSVPLEAGGKPFAALVMGRTQESGRRYDRADIELAEELAHRFAQALENARLRADAAAAQERLLLLARVGELVTVELDSTARLERVAHLVLPTIADCCSVYVNEPDGRARLCAFAHVDPAAQEAFDASGALPVLAGDTAAPPVVAMRTGRPSLLPDVPSSLVTDVLTTAKERDLARTTAIRSMLAVPLHGPEGTIGALAFAYAGSGRRYGDDDVPIAEEIARRVAPALENAFRFEREQATAEILQRSLLPEELPAIEDVELTARYLPGTSGVKIGGDWYDVVDMGPGRVVLAIGDVVGHGVRAAAAMGKLRHTLQLFAYEGLTPSRILERLNAYVCADASGDMATLLVMVYSQETGTLRFASAGHPPPLVREPDGALTYLPGGRGMPLGASSSAEYVEDHVQLRPGSVLVMYTDGLVERRREALDVGFLRLGEALAHAPEELDPIADHLLDALLESGGPRDDVALLVTRPRPAPAVLELTLPARPQELAPLRRTIGSWLTRGGASPNDVFDVTLSVNEIVANAIEHAYGVDDAEFQVDARFDDGAVVFVVRDTGQWREPPAAGDRGRGLQIVQKLMHDVDVRRTPGGTEVIMRRRLHHPSRGNARG
jgi:PAS domain S-box-containing protein